MYKSAIKLNLLLDWDEARGGVRGPIKEILGPISFFNWHCGMPMLKVIEIRKIKNPLCEDIIKIKKSSTNGFFCRVCFTREFGFSED